jgi:hypothetical protein
MPRVIVLAMAFAFLGASAFAQTPMKPTAPQKMMSPREAEKMRDCEKQAADQNVRMELRSKFVMDCMTKK